MRTRAWTAATAALAITAAALAGCGGGRSRTGGPPEAPETHRDVVSACPSGSRPDRPGPADQLKPRFIGGILSAAVDAGSATLVVLGGVPDGARGVRGQTWTLDLCTNTWHQQHPSGGGPEGTPETQLVYDAASDVVIAWSPRDHEGWAYDLDRDRWTRLAPAPAAPQAELQDAVYDPAGRRVILRDGSDGRLWSYRYGADTWRAVTRPSPADDAGTADSDFHSYMVSDPARHQLILVQNAHTQPGRTWRFDLDSRRWTRYPTATPEVINGYFELGTEMAFDPGADRALLLGYAQLVAFDPGAGTWREVVLREPLVIPRSGSDADLHTGPLVRTAHTLVHDPVNGRVLVLGGMYHPSDPPDPVRWARSLDVWAYETSSDTWTQLVAP